MPEKGKHQPGSTTPTTARAHAGRTPGWKSLWPIPVLLLGAGLLAAGVLTTIARGPKVDPASPLADARALVEMAKFDQAVELLNAKALPSVEKMRPADQQEFYRLRASALFQGQLGAGLDRAETDAAIVDDFTRATEKGATLTPVEIAALAQAHLGTGDAHKAVEEALRLPASENARKRRLLKRVVERNLGSDNVRFDETLGLLADLAQDQDQPPEEAAWVLARQGELLIAGGRAGEAVAKLLRELQRLRAVPPEREGELYVILGRALIQAGQHAEAEKQLERAATLIEPTAPLQAEVNLLSGMVRQARGQLEDARERFSRAITDFGSTPAYIPALAGLAATKASLGDDQGALESYAEVVEQLPKAAHRGGVTPQTVADGLMARYAELMQTEGFGTALRYALLAESLFADSVPSPVLLGIAGAHERLGAQGLTMAVRITEVPGGAEGSVGSSGGPVDPVTREEAKRHFLAAGEYYLRHARSVVVNDLVAASGSRWNAADCFDRAGDLDGAIKSFGDFLQSASDDDAHRSEARFRLAQAFQAKGEFATAAALYGELIASRPEPGSPRLNAAGLWADRAAVPLAQCYSQDADATNDAAAEELLLSIVGGRDLAPEAMEFRAALLELGRMYYEQGKYAQAIERLGEAVGRFPSDAEINALRFRLADSMRLSAREIDKSLEEAMPQNRRDELQKTRAVRRQEAIRLFQQVKAALEARPGESLTELERVYLRNAEFYVGDCAYDLGDYDAAITAYDAARQKYAGDPASLVAMVQIVNAYVQQGQWAKAATANERARQHLERFPDAVWSMPNLPMEKEHWRRWLDSRSLLQQRTEATGPG